jgi:5'-nucleotidase
MDSNNKRVIHILHFNDVYNLYEKDDEPVGGAARFITAAAKYKELNPLVLFRYLNL